jgi:hypothetical protein
LASQNQGEATQREERGEIEQEEKKKENERSHFDGGASAHLFFFHKTKQNKTTNKKFEIV